MAYADSVDSSVPRIILTWPTGERSSTSGSKRTTATPGKPSAARSEQSYRRITEVNNTDDGMDNNSSQFPALSCHRLAINSSETLRLLFRGKSLQNAVACRHTQVVAALGLAKEHAHGER